MLNCTFTQPLVIQIVLSDIWQNSWLQFTEWWNCLAQAFHWNFQFHFMLQAVQRYMGQVHSNIKFFRKRSEKKLHKFSMSKIKIMLPLGPLRVGRRVGKTKNVKHLTQISQLLLRYVRDTKAFYFLNVFLDNQDLIYSRIWKLVFKEHWRLVLAHCSQESSWVFYCHMPRYGEIEFLLAAAQPICKCSALWTA